MDNEAPKYAEWIPTAGGYVANGNVVSNSPIYDGNGKLKVTVDTTEFGNTQPQNSVIKAEPKSANNPLTNNGITTANTTGSGVDVNSAATGVGSLGTLTNNTPTTGNPLATSAVNSPLISMKPEDALDEVNQKYLDAVARNDYKGMIDALTEASNIDGIDRTEQINNLWQKRGEKVRTQDDAYSSSIQQLKNAIATTQADSTLSEEEKAQKVAALQGQLAELTNSQQAYRDMVGYDDQMARDRAAMEQEIQLNYEYAYKTGLNDISNGIMAGLTNLINFQYDPSTDENYLRAKAQVELSMRNQMNATGMYYSSTTQYAIAQAIGELIPVYEQMAKDEIKENLSMMMNVGNYLMNLEKTQFDMWKSQIELKWEENAEKRAQIKSAIDAGNARGYYTNEEALLLGVAGGTESSEARKRALDKLDSIEASQRQLDIQKKLYEFTSNMDWEKEKMRTKMETDEKIRYYNATTGAQQTTGNGNMAKVKWTDPETGAEYEYYIPYNGNGQFPSTPNSGTTPQLTEDAQKAVSGYKDADGNYDIKAAKTYINSKDFKALSPEDQNAVISDLYSNYYMVNLDNYAKDYGEDYSKTRTAYKNAINDVEEFAEMLDSAGMSDAKQSLMLEAIYGELMDGITSAAEFDNIFADIADTPLGNKDIDRQKGKDFAILDVIKKAENSSNAIVKNVIAPEIKQVAINGGMYEEKEAQNSATANAIGFAWANPITNPTAFMASLGYKGRQSWRRISC